MDANHPEFEKSRRISDLTTQVLAAEMNLTFFASRSGKASPVYQDSLKDFATVWYLLKKHRRAEEFVKDIVAV